MSLQFWTLVVLVKVVMLANAGLALQDLHAEPLQQSYISAASYNVVCDGVGIDSATAQNALNAASSHGGAVVVFVPTGAACKLLTGLTVPVALASRALQDSTRIPRMKPRFWVHLRRFLVKIP
jgi:hypothetical protein